MTGTQWVMLAALVWVFLAAITWGVVRGGTRQPTATEDERFLAELGEMYGEEEPR